MDLSSRIAMLLRLAVLCLKRDLQLLHIIYNKERVLLQKSLHKMHTESPLSHSLVMAP